MAALQLSEIGEQRGDLAAGVLVDAVEAHEGVEDEQPRLQLGNRLGEATPIGLQIEAEGGGGDDQDIEIGKGHAGGGRDALKPPAHDCRGVLGGIEEDAAGVGYRKAAQAGNTGGNGDGQIERQERLAALWLAADDADSFMGPQIGDEPAQFCRLIGQAPGRLDG